MLHRHLRASLLSVFFLVLTALLIPRSSASQSTPLSPPVLNEGVASITSNAGYFSLSWTSDKPVEAEAPFHYQVVSSTSPSFTATTVVYEGPEPATLISGKPDGNYYYRARHITTDALPLSAWSDPLHVDVSHHTLQRAFSFLSIGALVFVATCALIIGGHLKERQSLQTRNNH